MERITQTQKGQGATEYIVLLSVVLGIALICITLLVWPVGTTKDAKKSQTDIHFKIAAMEYPDLLQGLVAYWKFDEGSGTSATDSRGGNTGTLYNSPSWVTGKSGQALSFNSLSSQYARLSSISNARSISLWANIPSGQTGYLLDARTGLTNGYVKLTGTNVGPGWTTLYLNGTSKTIAGATIPTDSWVHIYLESSTNFTDDINLMSDYGNGALLNGSIDEVMIFNRALSAGEIRLLYENPGYPQ